ncbi:MAG: hypothetical protein WCB27_07085 [Thermoguttaceae bacterium]
MAKLFPYASEPHPVWAPLAAKIHEAVWNDVGLEKVREFVRKWAEEFNQREAEVKKAQEDWRQKAKKLTKKAPERFRQHQLAQAKLMEKNPYPIKMVDTPYPPDLELPLPPPHRRLSEPERWAVLAAIHDYHLPDEQISPWPREQLDGPLPTNKRDRNRHLEELRKQLVGDHYWHLIEEAGRLAEGHKPFIERCLKELAAASEESPRSPGKGGRPRKWKDILDLDADMHQKNSDVTDKQIVKAYNTRYAGPIATGKRDKATTSSLEEARRYQKRVSSKTHG